MAKKAPTPSRSTPSPAPKRARVAALVRAEHHGAPVHLTAPERTVLNDALRRGEDVREQVESALLSYGRWLLGAVFKDDATAALDEKTRNPVWIELIRRAGGPTLRVSRRLIYVSLTVAAHDKRITDQSWRGLDSARKELLLPLRTDDRLRQGAQHVSKFNLTQAMTREYVSETLKSGGQTRQVRLTTAGLVGRVRKLRASLGTHAVLRKVGELRNGLEPAEREKAAGEIDKLTDVLNDVARALRGKR